MYLLKYLPTYNWATFMKKASSLSITIFLSPTTGPFKAATATSYKTPTYDYYYTTHTLHIFKEMCHYYYSMSKIFDAMTFLINLITALLCVCENNALPQQWLYYPSVDFKYIILDSMMIPKIIESVFLHRPPPPSGDPLACLLYWWRRWKRKQDKFVAVLTP